MHINYGTVMAIIPARSGSKGVLNKNIRLLSGHPLLAWSIMAARKAEHIDRVLVSTDSPEYVDIAKKYGAEAPFLRPEQYATDQSQDIEFFLHALEWLQEHENGGVPEYLVHLRPTTPLRDPEVIDKAIGMIQADRTATSLCSASEVYPPCKYFSLNSDGSFSALLGEELISLPRQQCPKAYDPNGYVDIVKSEQILSSGTLYGSRRLAFICDYFGDIDTERDFQELEHSHEMLRIERLLFDDFMN